MSGLGETGIFYGANVNAVQVQEKDLDRYHIIEMWDPSVSTTWFGTASGTVNTAITLLSQQADWPRNIAYTTTGGTVGGTFVVNGKDQFGVPFTESVVVGTSASGQTVYGTVICAQFLSGTVNVINTNTGTYNVGVGTASNGSAQSNWFGLTTKIGGTGDLKAFTWLKNGTPTPLNAGTALGTLVDVTRHAFQGTAGVSVTDGFRLMLKPTYDNTFKGTMSAL